MRTNGRAKDRIRPVRITKDYIKYPEGSVLIEAGDTKVICSASIEEKIPPFLQGSGQGWITAEYSMLPRSTHTRTQRESQKGKVTGRTHEIQRLIGRSMRSVVDMKALGERTVLIDCDVIQADGGTRTLSITGAYIAVHIAIKHLTDSGVIDSWPITDSVAAVSVGIIGGDILLDLDYEEDSNADVDMNVIMTGSGMFVEIQGTAEKSLFSSEQLSQMLACAGRGIKDLILKQNEILGIEN